ncbi:MAG: BTAD domain-containing putative transcriptional regulator [Solirubrobacteraceae bacterium]
MLGGVRQRALLAVLILHANEVRSTDLLIDQLWGEHPPTTAIHTIQVFVSRLRRALGAGGERLVTRSPGYLLRVGLDEVDAGRCERLYGQARSALGAGNPGAAAEFLRDGLGLWRGAPLADFTYEPFAQSPIARLEELRISCREELIEAELALGHHTDVILDLEALVREQPFRERPRGQLMLALYRCGRHADALEAFQVARRTMIDELAIEPSLTLRELEQAILRQDPSLVLPTARVVVADPLEAEPVDAFAATTHLPVTDLAAPREASVATSRKTATVLVVKLTATARSDPEVGRRLLGSARSEVERIVSYHGGTFVPGVGGQAVGLFGLPLTKEDDAFRALRAASECRAIVDSLGDPAAASLQIGVGIDTGEVVANAPNDVFGEPLESATAFSLDARNGEVLLGDTTRRMVSDTIRIEPALGLATWRLVSLIADAPAARFDSGVPIVGREDELAAARAAFARATDVGTAHMLLVTGDAGIGKSRLAHELGEEIESVAIVLSGRCLSYGDGIAFWPLREALSEAAGGESRDAIRGLLAGAPDADLVADIVAESLGLGDGDSPTEQVPWAFRRLFEALAADRPLLLVIDDAHSASLELLKLLTYLIDWLTAPVLVLCLARPDLFDPRPDWADEDLRAEWDKHPRVAMIKLAPLSDDDARSLMDHRLGKRRLSESERTHLIETTAGNPLFVEQLVAATAEDPWWDREYRIPATIQSLLAARLDRLGPGQSAVVKRAAVIGRDFWPSAVVELLPAEARASTSGHLRALIHRGLVEPERSILAGEEQLRFHHILIRDVAYRSTPKALRARLHERFADWLTQRGEEYEEFVGFHLENAFRYRIELDPRDGGLLALATRGGEALASAGRRARSRGDTNGAVRLLRRAAELLEAIGRTRPEVLLELGSALSESGDFPAAEPVLQAALDQARATGAEGLGARALIELSYWRSRAYETVRVPELRSVAERTIPIFARTGDDVGLSRAWLHIAWAHWIESHCADMETALERALIHAERSQGSRGRSQILMDLTRAAVLGPRPVDDGILRCQTIVERAAGDISLVAFTDTMLAVLESMAGRTSVARDRWRDGKRRLSDYGQSLTVALVQSYYAFIELIAGTPARAEPELRAACDEFAHIGERGRLSSAAALMARLLCEQGRYAESEQYSTLSRETASEDDALSQVYLRGAHARALARADGGSMAEDLASSAVALASTTDFLLLQGDAFSDRADVLATLNEPHRAARDLEAAIACYERKGIRPCAERAREAHLVLMQGSATPGPGVVEPVTTRQGPPR